ncbi:monocarboxylate transporter 12 isoform X1 [Dermacentor silvarum]|uniref:monocarboxylate transporter 12 isoform X1 n=1 Tax=Dermacentor silvarum TaxID=543639 RepID=UPI00189BE4E0|nr:monocarboxylate transporter 12 isoform X1 [Dermacentor silvarum]
MDSQRSWVVAGACFWTNVFAFPLLGAAGVVYINILQTFHVTREEASWPVSLTSTFYLLAGLLGGILNQYVTIRTILVISCTISALLVSSCYFTTSLWFLIIVLGVLHGIFVGGIRLNVVVINKHFAKYLSSASGLNMAGHSVGGFILPPLLQLLFDQYGFRGALLICGGVSLNAVPAALLCRDPDKPKPLKNQSETSDESCFGEDEVPEKEAIATELSATVYHTSAERDVLPDKPMKEVERYELLSPVLSEKSICTLESSLTAFRTTDLKNKPPLKGAAPNQLGAHRQDSAAVTEHSYGFILNPHFYLVTLTHLVVFSNMVTCLTVIIDFAVDCGVPKWNAVLLLPAYSVADVVARLGSGWVTDKRYLSRRAWTALCLLLWAAALASMPLGRSFGSLLVCAVVSGWCNGSTLSLVPVLYAEVTDALHYPLCFGAGSSLVGLANLLRPLLIGHFRDITGGYGGLFYFYAGCTCVMLVFWLLFEVRNLYKGRKILAF